jgi:RNA polymerase sigma factor (sigma-70 family)
VSNASTSASNDRAVTTHRAVEAVWRIESSRVIAALAGMLRDVGLAEEFAQDAFVAALEEWPKTGTPENPGAWLTLTARNKAIDAIRRRKTGEQRTQELARDFEDREDIDFAEQADRPVEDDLLRLVFTTCHPVLSEEARVALTLRLLGGLTTEEIARAFLVPESTIAQRIVRAKRTLRDHDVPFEVPIASQLPARLGSVLEVIYLIFNEGYSATAGQDWMRPALCEEAMRLGRIVVSLLPNEPEVSGLVSLMEINASRTPARTGRDGQAILLLEQDRSRWDRLLIRRGLAALEHAESLSDARGSYTLQAAIAACHARATIADDTDWELIARLYGELVDLTANPVVELNRAVAVSMAAGPSAGLVLVDQLRNEPALAQYHLFPAVRGDLLFKLDRRDEARAEFERAASLTRNEREREVLLARARDCADPGAAGPVR